MVINKKEVKLVIYLEDNNQPKDRKAIIIKKDEFGIELQLYDDFKKDVIGTKFFLPWHRVLKVKDLESENDK